MKNEKQMIVFLDRDGTFIAEPTDQQVDSLEKLEFMPGAISGLQRLVRAGFRLVMVTNQDHLGTDRYPRESFDLVQSKLLRLLEAEGIRFAEIFVCPHGSSDGCGCRKPRTGLVDAFLPARNIDLGQSWMVGDRETDVEFAGNIGVRPVRILNGPDDETAAVERVASFAEACETILSYQRSANVERKTTETSVSVKVRIDGTGLHEIRTGLGFFDHMLSLFVKHAAFDASVIVDGDLQVDEHHTVEDTGLVLGEAIRKALGEKKGIERYGFLLPMDEARSQVALDIGGRPFLRFDVSFTRERIGSVPTELFEDFFRAFSDGLRCNLHISADGRNEHHIIEACFKGVGRALRQAAKREERLLDVLPSTKGIL